MDVVGPKSVCIFGLSANPPTGLLGHQGIVKLLVSLGKYDEIWVCPVFHHAFPSKRNLAPFEDRLEMCRIAFERLGGPKCRVVVHDTERAVFLKFNDGDHAKKDSGTAELISELTSNYPDINFSMVLGADSYHDLISGKWCSNTSKSCPNQVKDLFGMLEHFEVISRRTGPQIEESVEAHTERIGATLHQFPPRTSPRGQDFLVDIEVSSTSVREHLRELGSSCDEDFSGVPEKTTPLSSSELIDPEVLRYARAKKLYCPPVELDPMREIWGESSWDDPLTWHTALGAFLFAAVIFVPRIVLRLWFNTWHRFPPFFSRFRI